MKNRLLFLLLIVFSYQSDAQIKILFDATKAETAGNADWILDANVWNLGYNPYPNLSGIESNAQQIPTPAQSGVNAGTSQEYWKGALSAWGIDLAKLDYIVESLPYYKSITYGDASNSQDLSNYKVFVVCEPNLLFTSSEKTAIMHFVQNGGGLFMISDHDNSDRNNSGNDSPHIWNNFMQNNPVQNNPFGISFDYEFFTEASSNIPNLPGDSLLHGSYGNVTNVEFYGGTSMSLNTSQNSSVKGVVYREGYANTGSNGALCAYLRYGEGKVVALGDSSPADDGSGDNNDNLYDGWIEDANGNHERLIMNATIWLATDNLSDVNDQASIANIFVMANTHHLYVKNPQQQKINISIINLMGQTIYQNEINTNETIRLEMKSNSLYIYQIQDQNGLVKTGKLILSR